MPQEHKQELSRQRAPEEPDLLILHGTNGVILQRASASFIKTDSTVNSSISTGLDEGGYKVRITDGGGYDTSLVAWIFLDKPFSEGKIQNFTCDYVALSGNAAIDTFYYKDPASGQAVKLPNAFSFLWSSDPASTIPYPSIRY